MSDEEIVKFCHGCERDDCIDEVTMTERFAYGMAGSQVVLSAEVVVLSCECGEQWTDYRGEQARTKAVDDYLRSKE